MASASEAQRRGFTAKRGQPCPCSHEDLMQSLQAQLRQAFESPQKSGEQKVATVAGQGFCTCEEHICDSSMSGETYQSAQVCSTGTTEKEPPLTRIQCPCPRFCALTASEIDRHPDLVSQLFADTAHPMKIGCRHMRPAA